MEKREFKGKLDAQGKRFALIVSRFNEFVSKELLAGALDCLERHNAQVSEVFWTSGTFEIPPVAKRLALSKKFSAIIALGAIIHGETPHAEYIASEVSRGLARVYYETGVVTTFGIITADTLEQAIDRAGAKAGNKGFNAALAAIEMVNLSEQIILEYDAST